MFSRKFEIFRGIEVSGAAKPWMNRVCSDDVKLFLRSKQKITPVIKDDPQPGIIKNIMVVHAERPCHTEHFRLDFRKRDLLNARVNGCRPQGHPAPRAEHEDALRVLVE